MKYALLSDKKLNLIAGLVRGKKVVKALDMLEYMPKKGARVLHKLIKSAAANAVNNNNLSLDALFIERIDVGRGPKIKRVRFVSRSRISHYEKYRSYVKVVLNTK
ncbi:MAG: 50S ribosomal protein L22 [bacterium]|nr:50S ribosomal protein L22 [bacterium]